jgi:hypothetical protein
MVCGAGGGLQVRCAASVSSSARSFSARDAGDAASRAWAAVEPLVATRDSVLLNALAVGLLEGHSPKRHLELMGARTRALHDHP